MLLNPGWTGDGPESKIPIMKTKQLESLRKALEIRRSELEGVVRSRESIAIESRADLIDQIQSASERDMAVGRLERESVSLREVRAALERIPARTFGTCLRCEEEISGKRLAAMPWAETCLNCQEQEEQSGSAGRSAYALAGRALAT